MAKGYKVLHVQPLNSAGAVPSSEYIYVLVTGITGSQIQHSSHGE